MTYTGVLNLTSPASNRVFQRDVRIGNPVGNWTVSYGKGWGTVTLGITPSTGAALIEYRVRDAENAGQVPLLNWASCGANIPAGSTTLAALLPARAGWSLIDIRANGDDLSIVTTGPIGVGEVIAATGQSLATDFWTTLATGDTATLSSCGVAPSPYGVCLAAWDGAPAPSPGMAWLVPGNTSAYNSTFCAEFLRLAVIGCGVSCGLVGYAWSGEPIASWAADGSGPRNVSAPLISTLDAAVGQGGTSRLDLVHTGLLTRATSGHQLGKGLEHLGGLIETAALGAGDHHVAWPSVAVVNSLLAASIPDIPSQ